MHVTNMGNKRRLLPLTNSERTFRRTQYHDKEHGEHSSGKLSRWFGLTEIVVSL